MGGYGRQELHPYSDIDILILAHESSLTSKSILISQFVTLLWDIGLQIGSSVRTVSQTRQMVIEDITCATSLLDARFLQGSMALFLQMGNEADPRKLWSSRDFYAAKRKEQELRYEKYGDTSYHLEPNLKESPGALRDIQTTLWIAQHFYGVKKFEELEAKGFLTLEELHILQKEQNQLWRLRTTLHHMTGRDENRLLFDYQLRIAQTSKPELSPQAAVENLMQNYYRTVWELNALNDMLLQWLDEVIYNDKSIKITRINNRFSICNGYIEVSSPKVFEECPESLIEIFVLFARRRKIKGLRATTIRSLRNHRYLITSNYKKNLKVTTLFMSLFQESGNIAKALKLMNRYGILGKYLNAFGHLIGRMQYDLYHIYTVDRHLIVAVHNIYRFTLEKYKEMFPLCFDLIKTIPKMELLYLAAFFHDMGKCHGGDHSKVGAKLTKDFCKTHHLSEQDTALLVWLVEHHLIMSVTAQRMDIYDPDVINHFANLVRNELYLKYLYLLTCADIWATNPALWNNWKASLLGNLYQSTLRVLSDNSVKIDKLRLIEQIQEQARMLMKESAMDASMINGLWNQWGNQYFLHHSPEKIVWHTQAILNHHHKEIPLVLVSSYKNQSGTEIFIHMLDRDFIFSNTTLVLDKFDLNIVEAQVITTADGTTLDSYIVIDKKGNPLTNTKKINELADALSMQLQNPHKPRLLKRYHQKKSQHFTHSPEIRLSHHVNSNETQLDITVPDRPGLLACIGMAFVDAEIQVRHAKIVTLGERVEDTFRITDKNACALSEEKQQKLSQELQKYLNV